MNISLTNNWLRLAVGIFILLQPGVSYAEPYLAYKNNYSCANCHVNPDGGSIRNQLGQIYGHSTLPSEPSELNASERLNISDYLQLGGDFRFNANFEKSEAEKETKSFEIHSAQLYAALKLPGDRLTLVLDQSVAPGVAINREAYLLYTMDNNQYLKLGKMFLPFGIRLEDDSAFVRQVTGTNFDNSDNGVAYGKTFGRTELDLFVTNGTSQVSNDDAHFLYGARVEHLFDAFRLGLGVIYNDKEATTRILNSYVATSLGRFTLLAEVDWIEFQNMADSELSDRSQFVALAEVNFEWRQGLNIKFTTEYFDPNQDIEEDQQTRQSLVIELTPISNLQFRLGLRTQDDVPQHPENNKERLFLQTHLYF